MEVYHEITMTRDDDGGYSAFGHQPGRPEVSLAVADSLDELVDSIGGHYDEDTTITLVL
jgi:hypothetical protein